jgi:hypothetical protein
MRLILFGGFRPFNRSAAVRDALAGMTLASMNVPQVLGYTRIAGTPVVDGLYTVLLPLVAFAVFGSSRHLVVAADSATAAIFYSSLSRMAVPASEKYTCRRLAGESETTAPATGSASGSSTRSQRPPPHPLTHGRGHGTSPALSGSRWSASPGLKHADLRRSRRHARRRGGGPLIAAEAVASGGMTDVPPASRRGPWCAESGLTKGPCGWQVHPQ